LLIVTVLIAFLSALVIPAGIGLYQDEIIERQTELLRHNLEKARDFAITGKLDSSWGVKFDSEELDCQSCYALFKGESFDQRNTDYDSFFNLPEGIDLEGMKEVVFEKGTGNPIITE